MSKKISIDLGSAYIRVACCGRKNEILFCERSVIAILCEKNRVVAFGNDALAIPEEEKNNYRISYPFACGKLPTADILRFIIREAIKKSVGISPLSSPEIMICLHCGIDSEEEYKITEVMKSLHIPKYYLCEAPFASCMGCGFNPYMAESHIIVNIGATWTDIGVISLGGIDISSSIKIGGHDFDNALATYIKRTYNLSITPETAEMIKHTLGIAVKQAECKSIGFTGINADGVEMEKEITSEEVIRPFLEILKKILEELSAFIGEIPIEYMSALKSEGIILCGGGAEMNGLEYLAKTNLNVKTSLAKNPGDCTALGGAALLKMTAEYPKGSRIISRNFEG